MLRVLERRVLVDERDVEMLMSDSDVSFDVGFGAINSFFIAVFLVPIIKLLCDLVTIWLVDLIEEQKQANISISIKR